MKKFWIIFAFGSCCSSLMAHQNYTRPTVLDREALYLVSEKEKNGKLGL